jgi:hypothetical protein
LPISPKSYRQILDEMIGQVANSTTIKDLESGSIVKTLLDMQAGNERDRLINFLAKLDNRFKKYQDPWSDLKLAQRYFSKL